MLAKDEREAAARGEGCLGKASDDEPVFILRARDITAPDLVDSWCHHVRRAASYAGTVPPLAKLDEAKHLMLLMRDWQKANGCKVPD